MCGGVASRMSSPTWVAAVVGVRRLTTVPCVRALVRKSHTVKKVEFVHARLVHLDEAARKRFAADVCKGCDAVKCKSVCAWLEGN